ncbi:MAG: outer membrane beta-barrel protein [Thermoguttaceae bacterium]
MAASLLLAISFCPSWASAQVALASDDLRQPAASPDSGSAAAPGPKTDQPAPTAGESAASDASCCYRNGFFRRFWQANVEAFQKKDEAAEEETPPARRALPAPFASPPFPSAEYQGYPLIGVPASDATYPLMKAIDAGPHADFFKENKINLDGWVNASANWSNARNSNAPTAYWLDPNALELNQMVLRAQRTADTVQTDHIDWGFRSVLLYGQDYRYMVAGGWQPASDELLLRNEQYGLDLTEQYVEVYLPGITRGMEVRVGRWIACPDIETQYAPDNYMATHSLLFTYDTYTQTGVMFSFMLNEQWMVQGAITAGTDMAPWYEGATPTGMFGVRWVSEDNKDSIYTCLNNINSAEFRHFDLAEGPAGHDNFNYIVSTWQHKFNDDVHTKTEGYFMWQNDAELGGTPSLGPAMPFGGGGGDGQLLPGISYTYGVVNDTMFEISKKDFITVRNEWWRDERGMRSGYPGTYTSHAIGLTHNFNSVLQIRPEVGYYRNWTEPAFDLGTKQGLWLCGFDMTYHF